MPRRRPRSMSRHFVYPVILAGGNFRFPMAEGVLKQQGHTPEPVIHRSKPSDEAKSGSNKEDEENERGSPSNKFFLLDQKILLHILHMFLYIFCICCIILHVFDII